MGRSVVGREHGRAVDRLRLDEARFGQLLASLADVNQYGRGVILDVEVTRVQGNVTVVNAGTFAVQADTELTTADLDSGAGTDTRAVVGLVYGASGGGVLVSTTIASTSASSAGAKSVSGTSRHRCFAKSKECSIAVAIFATAMTPPSSRMKDLSSGSSFLPAVFSRSAQAAL